MFRYLPDSYPTESNMCMYSICMCMTHEMKYPCFKVGMEIRQAVPGAYALAYIRSGQTKLINKLGQGFFKSLFSYKVRLRPFRKLFKANKPSYLNEYNSYYYYCCCCCQIRFLLYYLAITYFFTYL